MNIVDKIKFRKILFKPMKAVPLLNIRVVGVIRIPFSNNCDRIGRKIIHALALVFSLGLARHSLKIQKLKQEISENNKIIYIPKDKAIAYPVLKKVDDAGKQALEDQKKIEPEQPKKPQTPIKNQPQPP